MFAEEQGLDLIEINFEERPEYRDLIPSNDIRAIIQLLEIEFRKEIQHDRTCIFFDEIQNHPQVLHTLRYFYEKQPDLPVIAAGSLLEFLLEDLSFSMPVGRIEYLFLGPMTFEEYLIADDQSSLLQFVESVEPGQKIPTAIHQAAIRSLRTWILTGGMPEILATWLETQSFLEVDRVKQSILNTFRDDFNKYKKRLNTGRLQTAFSRFPGFVGKKIVYSRIDDGEKSRDLETALRLLEQARIIYRVCHSNGNGVPLGAEVNEKRKKGLFLDVGLLSGINGLSIADITNPDQIMQVNSGALVEQFIGQHLLYMNDFFRYPELYYWSRQKSQSSAEIDFLVPLGSNIVPIEVKAGKAGTLRSLHVFMEQKRSYFAVRFYAGALQLSDVKSSLAGSTWKYQLLSLPLYLVEQWKRLSARIVS
jgi:predicted AAA+ superfamily ATPase